jgi:dihydropteroate synthase
MHARARRRCSTSGCAERGVHYDGGVSERTWRCGDRDLPLGLRTLVMGVVNVTPDSFSDGGLFTDTAQAVAFGAGLADDGADIVDVGGESTRPGANDVSADEEIDRVVPVIDGLRRARPDVVVSVDTRRPVVAKAAIDAGAHIVNDVGGAREPTMLDTVATASCGLVLMHMLGEPRTMQDDPRYDDVVAEIHEYLRERVEAAVFAGLSVNRLAVDPGIGFGKTLEHNLALLRALDRFGDLDAAVVIGASRKRFIGTLTGVERPADRREGSIAAAVVAASAGADVVRAHDVAQTVRALAVADAVYRGWSS